MSEYECEASMWRPWPTRGWYTMTKKVREPRFIAAAQKIKYENTKNIIVPAAFYRRETWNTF